MRLVDLIILLVVLIVGSGFHLLRVRGLKKKLLEMGERLAESERACSSSDQQLEQAQHALLAIEEQILERNLELEKAKRKLDEMSNQDSLTGVANRQYLEQFLNLEWRRASRESMPLSLLMIDIDFFKLYNDCYGRQAGDDCLKRVAQTLCMINRPGDLVARIGGEKFLVVLSNTDREGALKLAERMRQNVASLRIPHTCSIVDVNVTISLGVAAMVPERDSFFSQGILQADKALDEAKQKGRNRVCLFPPSPN